MGDPAKLVTAAREQVILFKGGAVGEANLAEEVETTPLSSVKDIAEFAAEVSARFERIAALLYHHRHDLTDETIELARWAHEQRSEIESRLEKISKVGTKSSLEDLGKLWINETLDWALGLLDTEFPQWGYPD